MSVESLDHLIKEEFGEKLEKLLERFSGKVESVYSTFKIKMQEVIHANQKRINVQH